MAVLASCVSDAGRWREESLAYTRPAPSSTCETNSLVLLAVTDDLQLFPASGDELCGTASSDLISVSVSVSVSVSTVNLSDYEASFSSGYHTV